MITALQQLYFALILSLPGARLSILGVHVNSQLLPMESIVHAEGCLEACSAFEVRPFLETGDDIRSASCSYVI